MAETTAFCLFLKKRRKKRNDKNFVKKRNQRREFRLHKKQNRKTKSVVLGLLIRLWANELWIASIAPNPLPPVISASALRERKTSGTQGPGPQELSKTAMSPLFAHWAIQWFSYFFSSHLSPHWPYTSFSSLLHDVLCTNWMLQVRRRLHHDRLLQWILRGDFHAHEGDWAGEGRLTCALPARRASGRHKDILVRAKLT